MVEVRNLALDGVLEIIPFRHSDGRGHFSETFNAALFKGIGIDLSFIQDNHSYTAKAGVVRGLHYQIEPMSQAKLVSVVRGRVFDVAVDIREGSATFGHWVSIELSATRRNQVLVPQGFAHGFMTLEDDTEVLYKVTNHYCRRSERVIRYDDPAIGIRWPLPKERIVVSDRDGHAPHLNEAIFSDEIMLERG